MVIVAASVVTAGFFVGVSPFDLRSMPRPMGLVYGLISSLSIAVHAVLVKGSLPVVGGSVTQLSYWSNLSTACALGVATLINGEAVTFVSLLGSGTWDWRVFLWGNLLTGLFGFLISIAGILSVKVTSPVTHMFSSVSAKSKSRVFQVAPLTRFRLAPSLTTSDRSQRHSDPAGGQALPRHLVRQPHRLSVNHHRGYPVSVRNRVWLPPFGSVDGPLTLASFYTWVKSRQTGDEWQQKSGADSDVEAQRLLESDDEASSEKKAAGAGAFEKALESVVREKS
jgi:hypothetical protein